MYNWIEINGMPICQTKCAILNYSHVGEIRIDSKKIMFYFSFENFFFFIFSKIHPFQKSLKKKQLDEQKTKLSIIVDFLCKLMTISNEVIQSATLHLH